jgi:SAM-dependent methyltransferase
VVDIVGLEPPASATDTRGPLYQRACRRDLLAMSQILLPGDPAYAGQAQYTPRFLNHVYDPLVVRFANRIGWRCPSSVVLRHYNEHVRAVHLDAGPGTGWFLDRCRFPADDPQITLLDVNEDVLDASAKTLRRYRPRRHQANVLEPIVDLAPASHDSAALAHVLHCLPGSLAEKACALEHVAALVRPGGTVFGSTVLAEGVPHTRFSRSYNDYLNEIGVFSNRNDSFDALDDALALRFERYDLAVVGTVALFAAVV